MKRRTKVIGRFPGVTSCLSMCWAVLDLFLAGARGLGLSDLQYKQVGSMKIAHTHREHTINKVAEHMLTAGGDAAAFTSFLGRDLPGLLQPVGPVDSLCR